MDKTAEFFRSAEHTRIFITEVADQIRKKIPHSAGRHTLLSIIESIDLWYDFKKDKPNESNAFCIQIPIWDALSSLFAINELLELSGDIDRLRIIASKVEAAKEIYYEGKKNGDHPSVYMREVCNTIGIETDKRIRKTNQLMLFYEYFVKYCNAKKSPLFKENSTEIKRKIAKVIQRKHFIHSFGATIQHLKVGKSMATNLLIEKDRMSLHDAKKFYRGILPSTPT